MDSSVANWGLPAPKPPGADGKGNYLCLFLSSNIAIKIIFFIHQYKIGRKSNHLQSHVHHVHDEKPFLE